VDGMAEEQQKGSGDILRDVMWCRVATNRLQIGWNRSSMGSEDSRLSTVLAYEGKKASRVDNRLLRGL